MRRGFVVPIFICVIVLQKDLLTKELESRNTSVLHQLADISDAMSGMSLVIAKLLYEKGLQIPAHGQHNASGAMSRARSRASLRSSGRASECSLTINSREDDGIISRSLYIHDESDESSGRKRFLLILYQFIFSVRTNIC